MKTAPCRGKRAGSGFCRERVECRTYEAVAVAVAAACVAWCIRHSDGARAAPAINHRINRTPDSKSFITKWMAPAESKRKTKEGGEEEEAQAL